MKWSASSPRSCARLRLTFLGLQDDFVVAIAQGFPLLRTFAFDHPWASRSSSLLFPFIDDNTIRSEANGDFQIISVVGEGNSIAAEILKRICKSSLGSSLLLARF